MKQLLVTMAVLVIATASYGSQVRHQKLEDMISSVTVIVVATVQKAEKVSGKNCYRYDIEVTNVLAGELPQKRLTVTYWEQGSPRFSLIVPASGIESSMKEGQRYVLLFDSVKDEGGLGVVLTRAEPEERRDAVSKAWRERKQKDQNDKQGANALEPTAVGAFTMTITDNIASPSSATPHSTAAAQLDVSPNGYTAKI